MKSPHERRSAWLQAGFILLTVVLDPPPEVSQRIRTEPDVDAVEFGKPFELVVERRWSEELAAEPWDDAALAPLVVLERGRDSRSDDDVVVETIRFEAYAFERDSIRIAKPRWGAAATGGNVIPAVVAGFELRVTSSLPAADSGVPELPGEPFAEPRARWTWIVPLGVALIVIAWFVLRPRRMALAGSNAMAPSRAEAWRARIDRVESTPQDAAMAAFAGIARECASAERGFPAHERTTEEIAAWLAGAAHVEHAARAAAEGVLRRADRVKFAQESATAVEVVAARAATHAIVRALLTTAESRA